MLRKFSTYLKNQRKNKRIIMSIGFLLLIALVIYIPFSLAVLTPIKSITITSEHTNYETKEAGSWQVKKSAVWKKKGEAEITFDVDTVIKTDSEATDIILVLDVSGSMNGEKLNRVKNDTVELVNSLLENSQNKVALITFETKSTLVSGLTNDKEGLVNTINGLSTGDTTNYYQALVNVDSILKDYQKEDRRECIVLFLTDGYPNEDIPNQNTYFDYLKDNYPYINVNGIQYEMGSDVLDPVKRISDNQYLANMDTLNNVLFEASVAPLIYKDFSITDFINTDYFYVESSSDIKASQGSIEFDKENQKFTWKIEDLKSGSKASITINAKLKEEFINKGGVYPTNKQEEVKSTIDEENEDVVSKDSPILADNYKVIYEGNAPDGCSVTDIPNEENHSVFNAVRVSEKDPKCEGYQFKGWKVVTKSAKKINDNHFIMPEEDVVIRATWSKLTISKSMEGEVYTVPTLYKLMSSNSKSTDSGINFGSRPTASTSGIYQVDSTKNDEYPVYYYRGIVDNNNVSFAGFCWKMVRTTETGGVKLIYNGVVSDDGSCNNTGTASQIGTSKFNNSSSSPADVGYMYGTRYTYNSKSMPTWYGLIGRSTSSYNMLTSTRVYSSDNYYYGDTIEWDGENYKLVNSDGSEVVQTPWNEGYSSLKGKYRCSNGSQTICNTIYYLGGTDSSYAYTLSLTGGNTLDDVNTDFSFSKKVNYVDGKYVLEEPTVIKKADWYTKYNSLNGYYFCSDGSNSCTTVNYNISTSNYYMTYLLMNNGETYDSLYEQAQNTKWKYGNDVEWDGSKYVLKNTMESSPLDWSSEKSNIGKGYHYTCFSLEDSCSSVSYIYYTDTGGPYYIVLSNGKKIEEANEEMFNSNTTNSTIKTTIDNWYSANMTEYTSMLEDTIWCNDRSMSNSNGWTKDGDANNYLYFGGRVASSPYKPSLECKREEDRFTVSEEKGNGKLTYPVALLTADELTLAGHGWRGFNQRGYLCTGEWWWALSPNYFNGYSVGEFGVYGYGILSNSIVVNSYGVRPAVSLVPGTMVSEGDGTVSNPYQIMLGE